MAKKAATKKKKKTLSEKTLSHKEKTKNTITKKHKPQVKAVTSKSKIRTAKSKSKTPIIKPKYRADTAKHKRKSPPAKKPKASRTLNRNITFLAAAAIIILVLYSLTQLLLGKEEQLRYSGERVKLDFYIRGLCPYSGQVMKNINPILKEAGDYIEFTPYHIATLGSNGVFTSLQGPAEVAEDLRQVCAIKNYPEDYRYMDYILCRYANLQKDWLICADEAGIDYEQMIVCSEGDEGKALLKKSTEESQKVGARGSPTMYLQSKQYSEGRNTTDFLKAVCGALKEKPPLCETLPKSEISTKNQTISSGECGPGPIGEGRQAPEGVPEGAPPQMPGDTPPMMPGGVSPTMPNGVPPTMQPKGAMPPTQPPNMPR